MRGTRYERQHSERTGSEPWGRVNTLENSFEMAFYGLVAETGFGFQSLEVSDEQRASSCL